MDPGAQENLASMVYRINQERGISVIIVSHDVNLIAKYAHRILYITKGKQSNAVTSLLFGTVDPQSTPVSIDVSEPVFDYMGDALNLKVNDPKFAKAVEEGNDPTASDFANVQNDIKNKKIKLFVLKLKQIVRQ